MARLRPELLESAEQGLAYCRGGEWKKGLPILASVLENRWPGEDAPGVLYSFLGYGVARYENKIREGIKLCEHAIKLEFYEADNHYNLARVQVLYGDRRAVIASIDRGLKLHPSHPGLLELQREVGVRRRPVLRFLDRDHPLNVFLGRIRHSMRSSSSPSHG